MIIAQIEESEKIKESKPSKCPSKDRHRWEDDYSLGSICHCNTWQIVELINYNSFWAIDFAGYKQVFDRSSYL